MTNQTADGDQNIIITYILKADESIKKAQEIRNNINSLKEKMKEVAKQSQTSFADVAKAMRDAANVKYTTQLKELETELRKLQTEYRNMKVASDEEKQSQLNKINNQKQAIQDLRREYNLTTKEISAAQSELQKGAGKGAGIFSGLGGIAGQAAGIAGALVGVTSLMAVLQKATQFMQSAAIAAKEFTQSVWFLSVGIRALQRSGIEITMKDVGEQLDSLRKRFGIFSTRELVQGSAAFFNLNRDMGLTKEQLFKLQEAVATLAVVNGRSMDEVQKTVALALSSGYTEGLQRLGVSINRVTIASEAAALGWKNGYTSLTEQQRALATYNLVIRKTAVYQEDLLEYQKTLPGQIDATTASIEDQTVALGRNTLALQLWLKQAQLYFLEAINMGFMRLTTLDDFTEKWIANQEKALGRSLTNIERGMESFYASEAFDKLLAEKPAISAEEMLATIGLPDVDVATNAAEKEYAEISKIVDENLNNMLQIQEDYEQGSIDLQTEYGRDKIQLQIEHNRRTEELEIDHVRRMDEINRDHLDRLDEIDLDYRRRQDEIELTAGRKAEDAQTKYLQDVAQTWADYYARVADAQAKYENQQWKAEQDFQEKMRRLREGFMFDLEDALRERDARQVMNLIRKYKLDKDQLTREYEQTREENWRNFQLQMADLARQRDQRLAQLAAELRARLDAIDAEAKREREDNDIRNRQRLEDEQIAWEQRKEDEARRARQSAIDEMFRYQQATIDRRNKYKQDEIDLQTHLTTMYNEIAQSLADQITNTDTSMATLLKVLTDTLGTGGEAEGIFNQYVGIVTNATTATQNLINTIPMLAGYMGLLGGFQFTSPFAGFPPNELSTPVVPPTYRRPRIPTRFRAQGGTMIADKATDVTFGEAGLEMAQFTPLTRPLTPSLETNLSSPLFSGGREKVMVEIILDKYLEGRIIDTALDDVADVIFRRLR